MLSSLLTGISIFLTYFKPHGPTSFPQIRSSFQVTFVDQYLGVADLFNSVIFTFLAYIIPLRALVFCNEYSCSPIFDESNYLFISCATFPTDFQSSNVERLNYTRSKILIRIPTNDTISKPQSKMEINITHRECSIIGQVKRQATNI